MHSQKYMNYTLYPTLVFYQNYLWIYDTTENRLWIGLNV